MVNPPTHTFIIDSAQEEETKAHTKLNKARCCISADIITK